MSKIKISIIEDSEIHSEWLKEQFVDDDRFELVSVDRFGRMGALSVKKHDPSIVILDFQLSDISGLEVANIIKHFSRKIKIFILTAHTESSIIERMLNDKNIDAISIKGSYYLESNFLPSILDVVEGGAYLDPSLLKKIRDHGGAAGIKCLTRKEFEIFVQMSSGKNDVDIANDLCVELPYIKNIKSRIVKKIRADNVDAIVHKLIENSSVR